MKNGEKKRFNYGTRYKHENLNKESLNVAFPKKKICSVKWRVLSGNKRKNVTRNVFKPKKKKYT